MLAAVQRDLLQSDQFSRLLWRLTDLRPVGVRSQVTSSPPADPHPLLPLLPLASTHLPPPPSTIASKPGANPAQVRRFRPGLDYTVAHYGGLTREGCLDATLARRFPLFHEPGFF